LTPSYRSSILPVISLHFDAISASVPDGKLVNGYTKEKEMKNMKMKRRLVHALIVLFVVSVAVSAGAKARESGLENTVVVYSTHDESMLEVVAEAFEQKTGVKVELPTSRGDWPTGFAPKRRIHSRMSCTAGRRR